MPHSGLKDLTQIIYRYLENTVVPTLTQALTQMCIQEPEDPICWLAQVRILGKKLRVSLVPIFVYILS